VRITPGSATSGAPLSRGAARPLHPVVGPPRANSRRLEESLRGNVCAVWPHNGTGINEETAKVRGVPERLEDGAAQPLPEIHGLDRALAEGQANPVPALVVR